MSETCAACTPRIGVPATLAAQPALCAAQTSILAIFSIIGVVHATATQTDVFASIAHGNFFWCEEWGVIATNHCQAVQVGRYSGLALCWTCKPYCMGKDLDVCVL